MRGPTGRVTWYCKGEKQVMWRCGTRLDGKTNCRTPPPLRKPPSKTAVMEAISLQYIHKDETLETTMQSIRSVLTPETADSEYAIRTKNQRVAEGEKKPHRQGPSRER